jgi:hypothetical protein
MATLVLPPAELASEPPTANLGPKQKHLRHGLACLACEQGRKKCDGERPCERCRRLGKECVDGKAALRRLAKMGGRPMPKSSSPSVPCEKPVRRKRPADDDQEEYGLPQGSSSSSSPATASLLEDPVAQSIAMDAARCRTAQEVGVELVETARRQSGEPRVVAFVEQVWGDKRTTEQFVERSSDLLTWCMGQSSGLPRAKAASPQAVLEKHLRPPSRSLTPRHGLLDAPLCSPQGIAVWTELFTRALASGNMLHMEEGIKGLLCATPGAAERLGVPFVVSATDGTPIRGDILPPGHHSAHWCNRIGVGAGGVRSRDQLTIPGSVPSGFDDVVESALAGAPVPAIRLVYDDLTSFPISVFANEAAQTLFGMAGPSMIGLLNAGREINWLFPDSVVSRSLANVEAIRRRLTSFRFQGKYLRFIPEGVAIGVRHSVFEATELVNLMYGPTGRVRSSTSFFLDVRFTHQVLEPKADVDVARRISTVLLRSPEHFEEAIATMRMLKKPFEIELFALQDAPKLPSWEHTVERLSSGLDGALAAGKDRFLNRALKLTRPAEAALADSSSTSECRSASVSSESSHSSPEPTFRGPPSFSRDKVFDHVMETVPGAKRSMTRRPLERAMILMEQFASASPTPASSFAEQSAARAKRVKQTHPDESVSSPQRAISPDPFMAQDDELAEEEIWAREHCPAIMSAASGSVRDESSIPPPADDGEETFQLFPKACSTCAPAVCKGVTTANSLNVASLPTELPPDKVAVMSVKQGQEPRCLPAYEQALPNPQGFRIRMAWPTAQCHLDSEQSPFVWHNEWERSRAAGESVLKPGKCPIATELAATTQVSNPMTTVKPLPEEPSWSVVKTFEPFLPLSMILELAADGRPLPPPSACEDVVESARRVTQLGGPMPLIKSMMGMERFGKQLIPLLQPDGSGLSPFASGTATTATPPSSSSSPSEYGPSSDASSDVDSNVLGSSDPTEYLMGLSPALGSSSDDSWHLATAMASTDDEDARSVAVSIGSPRFVEEVF